MVANQVREGRVVLWTKGDECRKTGRQTAMAKELLDKNQIEYDEIRIADASKR